MTVVFRQGEEKCKFFSPYYERNKKHNERNKKHNLWEEIKLLFTVDMIIYMGNPNRFTDKL